MKSNNKNTQITVGNISSSGGEINIAGGNINKNKINLNITVINDLFDQLRTAVETRTDTPPIDKSTLQAEIQEVQSIIVRASEKKDTVDENALVRHFRNIAMRAPDILDVAVATLGNPLAGLGVAVKKIAEKAKEGT